MSAIFFQDLMRKFDPFDDVVLSAYHKGVCINWCWLKDPPSQVHGRLAMYQFFKTIPKITVNQVELVEKQNGQSNNAKEELFEVVSLKCEVTIMSKTYDMVTTAHIDRKEPLIYHQAFTLKGRTF